MNRTLKTKKAIAYGCILISAGLWGAIGVSVRYIAAFGINSIQNACFRIFITTLVLFCYILGTDRTKFRIHLKDFKYFFGSGICSILLNNVCYALSVQINTLSTAVILLYIAPFIVILLAYFFFHEKLTLAKMLALITCFLGCILVVGIGIFTGSSLRILGILAGIGSAVGYALYNIFTKVLVKRYDTVTVVFYTFLLAFIGAFSISSPRELVLSVCASPEHIPLSALSAILTSAVPYLLFPVGLKYVESGKASIVATFEVAASSVFGFLLYDEKLELMNIIGIVMILAAVVLLNLSENEKSIDRENMRCYHHNNF